MKCFDPNLFEAELRNFERRNCERRECDCREAERDDDDRNGQCRPQTHVHEVVGSVRLAELEEDPHNHRFAGVTEEIIQTPEGHVHRFCTKTDFYEDHFHRISVTTGTPVWVGEGEDRRHIHFIDRNTEPRDGHFHEFIVSTLIDNPIGD